MSPNARPPLITVIIPTYNRSWGLRRAVASVLAQTFPDFELIITDDASGDETEAICRTFDDFRIRYFRQPLNVGIGRNWGFGLSQARAPFVSLLMDDDGYYPTFLSDRMARSRPSPTHGWCIQVITSSNQMGPGR